MPAISIIIPCLNEEKYLGGLLDDLATQTYMPDEVIVADCNSEDGTTEVANLFKSKLPIKIVSTGTRTPGAARNAGAQNSSGEYLLFIDADMHIPNNFLKEINDSLESKPVDFLTPRFISDGRASVDTIHIWIIYWWIKINVNWLKKPAGIGGAMCVKKSVNDEVQGFDSENPLQDDRRYIEKLRKFGVSCTYLGDLKAITSSRRFAGKGFISSGLIKILQDSRILRSLSSNILKRLGREKKYGHYK